MLHRTSPASAKIQYKRLKVMVFRLFFLLHRGKIGSPMRPYYVQFEAGEHYSPQIRVFC